MRLFLLLPLLLGLMSPAIAHNEFNGGDAMHRFPPADAVNRVDPADAREEIECPPSDLSAC